MDSFLFSGGVSLPSYRTSNGGGVSNETGVSASGARGPPETSPGKPEAEVGGTVIVDTPEGASTAPLLTAPVVLESPELAPPSAALPSTPTSVVVDAATSPQPGAGALSPVHALPVSFDGPSRAGNAFAKMMSASARRATQAAGSKHPPRRGTSAQPSQGSPGVSKVQDVSDCTLSTPLQLQSPAAVSVQSSAAGKLAPRTRGQKRRLLRGQRTLAAVTESGQPRGESGLPSAAASPKLPASPDSSVQVVKKPRRSKRVVAAPASSGDGAKDRAIPSMFMTKAQRAEARLAEAQAALRATAAQRRAEASLFVKAGDEANSFFSIASRRQAAMQALKTGHAVDCGSSAPSLSAQAHWLHDRDRLTARVEQWALPDFPSASCVHVNAPEKQADAHLEFGSLPCLTEEHESAPPSTVQAGLLHHTWLARGDQPSTQAPFTARSMNQADGICWITAQCREAWSEAFPRDPAEGGTSRLGRLVSGILRSSSSLGSSTPPASWSADHPFASSEVAHAPLQKDIADFVRHCAEAASRTEGETFLSVLQPSEAHLCAASPAATGRLLTWLHRWKEESLLGCGNGTVRSGGSVRSAAVPQVSGQLASQQHLGWPLEHGDGDPADASLQDDEDWNAGAYLTPIAVLAGAHGTGKSAAVAAAAAELGYSVIEVSVCSLKGGNRCRKAVMELVGEAVSSRRLQRGMGGPSASERFAAFAASAVPQKRSRKSRKDVALKPGQPRHPSRRAAGPQVPHPRTSADKGPGSLGTFFRPTRAQAKVGSAPLSDESSDDDSVVAAKPLRGGLLDLSRTAAEADIAASSTAASVDNSQYGAGGAPAAAGQLSLLLFEEVDVLFSDDKGFHLALRELALRTRCPVVLTTSAPPPWLPGLALSAEHITFPAAHPLRVWAWMQAAALGAFGVVLEPARLLLFVMHHNCDLRRCLGAVPELVRTVRLVDDFACPSRSAAPVRAMETAPPTECWQHAPSGTVSTGAGVWPCVLDAAPSAIPAGTVSKLFVRGRGFASVPPAEVQVTLSGIAQACSDVCVLSDRLLSCMTPPVSVPCDAGHFSSVKWSSVVVCLSGSRSSHSGMWEAGWWGSSAPHLSSPAASGALVHFVATPGGLAATNPLGKLASGGVFDQESSDSEGSTAFAGEPERAPAHAADPPDSVQQWMQEDTQATNGAGRLRFDHHKPVSFETIDEDLRELQRMASAAHGLCVLDMLASPRANGARGRVSMAAPRPVLCNGAMGDRFFNGACFQQPLHTQVPRELHGCAVERGGRGLDEADVGAGWSGMPGWMRAEDRSTLRTMETTATAYLHSVGWQAAQLLAAEGACPGGFCLESGAWPAASQLATGPSHVKPSRGTRSRRPASFLGAKGGAEGDEEEEDALGYRPVWVTPSWRSPGIYCTSDSATHRAFVKGLLEGAAACGAVLQLEDLSPQARLLWDRLPHTRLIKGLGQAAVATELNLSARHPTTDGAVVPCVGGRGRSFRGGGGAGGASDRLWMLRRIARQQSAASAVSRKRRFRHYLPRRLGVGHATCTLLACQSAWADAPLQPFPPLPEPDAGTQVAEMH